MQRLTSSKKPSSASSFYRSAASCTHVGDSALHYYSTSLCGAPQLHYPFVTAVSILKTPLNGCYKFNSCLLKFPARRFSYFNYPVDSAAAVSCSRSSPIRGSHYISYSLESNALYSTSPVLCLLPATLTESTPDFKAPYSKGTPLLSSPCLSTFGLTPPNSVGAVAAGVTTPSTHYSATSTAPRDLSCYSLSSVLLADSTAVWLAGCEGS